MRRSTWAGVQATVWTALPVSLAFNAISVSRAVHQVLLDVVGEALRELTVLLVLFPSFWIPFGCLAASVGSEIRRRSSSTT